MTTTTAAKARTCALGAVLWVCTTFAASSNPKVAVVAAAVLAVGTTYGVWRVPNRPTLTAPPPD